MNNVVGSNIYIFDGFVFEDWLYVYYDYQYYCYFFDRRVFLCSNQLGVLQLIYQLLSDF